MQRYLALLCICVLPGFFGQTGVLWLAETQKAFPL
jgi:hypothetical protein